jgi:hypothetical protein
MPLLLLLEALPVKVLSKKGSGISSKKGKYFSLLKYVSLNIFSYYLDFKNYSHHSLAGSLT